MIKQLTLFLLVFIAYVTVSCNHRGSEHTATTNGPDWINNSTIPKVPFDSINGAYLLLDKTRYDFGTVDRIQTPRIAMEFQVRNIGKTPLVIIKCDISCGCLSVDYPSKPIAPGSKSKLIVFIDTKDQEGEFSKSIFIKSNAQNDVVLVRIVGKVNI